MIRVSEKMKKVKIKNVYLTEGEPTLVISFTGRKEIRFPLTTGYEVHKCNVFFSKLCPEGASIVRFSESTGYNGYLERIKIIQETVKNTVFLLWMDKKGVPVALETPEGGAAYVL